MNHDVWGSNPQPKTSPSQGSVLKTHTYLGRQDRSRTPVFQAGLLAAGWQGYAAVQARKAPCGVVISRVEQKPAGALSGSLNV